MILWLQYLSLSNKMRNDEGRGIQKFRDVIYGQPLRSILNRKKSTVLNKSFIFGHHQKTASIWNDCKQMWNLLLEPANATLAKREGTEMGWKLLQTKESHFYHFICGRYNSIFPLSIQFYTHSHTYKHTHTHTQTLTIILEHTHTHTHF